MSDDRIIAAKITRVGLRALFSADNSGLQMKLSHLAIGKGQGGYASAPWREVCGFYFEGFAACSIYNCRLEIPSLDGSWGDLTTWGHECIFYFNAELSGRRSVTLTSCEIVLPAQIFGAILAPMPVDFYVWNLQITGAANLNGRVLRGYTSSAGVDPASSSLISTNLATI